MPRSGFPFSLVPCSPMVGRNLLGKAMTAGNLGGAIHRARRLLRSVRAELVIGLGGYPSVPVLIAARSLGLRTAIHECNAAPGMANKLLGRIVDRVYLGFEAATAQFRTERTLVTGNPVRADVAALAGEKRNPPGRGRPARIFVTGGSQGSAFLNREAPALSSVCRNMISCLKCVIRQARTKWYRCATLIEGWRMPVRNALCRRHRRGHSVG